MQYTGQLTQQDLYFSLNKIIYQGQVFQDIINLGNKTISNQQIWRLLTSLLFCQNTNIYLLFELLFFCYVSSSIEQSAFIRGSLDYLYYLIVSAVLIYLLAFIFNILYLHFIYGYALIYFYGKINSNEMVLIQFIPMRVGYLIWFYLLLHWVIRSADFTNMVISILVGHTMYFFFKIYRLLHFPKNKKIFDTPNFFVRKFSPIFDEVNQMQMAQEFQN